MKSFLFATRFATCFAICCVAVSASAWAQRSTHILLGGGAAIPVGTFDTTYKTGLHGLVGLTLGPPDAIAGLRLDYTYNGFHGRTLAGKRYRNTHVNALTANVVVPFRASYVKPYLIGGGGWYPYREAVDNNKRSNGWGVNGGLGISFPLPGTEVGGFIEGRLHVVYAAHGVQRRFVPVTVGVIF